MIRARCVRGARWALLAMPLAAQAASLAVRVSNPERQPVADVAVVLEAADARPLPPPAPAVIEQRHREFSPYVTIVQAGAAVEFPNRDKVKHHVYSFSPSKVFELKLYSGQPAKPVVFDKPGAVALGCNIHDWMEAHVLVVETPWFARTGADGRARIDKLPAGEYRLRLWHPLARAEFAPAGVRLAADSALVMPLTVDVAPRALRDKPTSDDAY